MILAFLLLLFGVNGSFAAETDGDDELPLLTDYHAIWALPESDQVYRMQFEVDVLYYDPAWGLLWLENENERFFCNPRSQRFDIHVGQRLLLECTSLSGRFTADNLQFTVIGEAEPLIALDAKAFLDRPRELNLQRGRFVGLVESQWEEDLQHVRMKVAFGRYTVNVTVLVDAEEAVRQFTGQWVEFDGFFSIFMVENNAGNDITLLVSGQDKLRSVGALASDERFSLSISREDELYAESTGDWVRVEGVVREAEAGTRVVLWDESNQIVVRTGRTVVPKVGQRITAVGQLESLGLEVVLQDGVWMESGAAAPDLKETPNLKLRQAAQVLELGLDEAAKGYPVNLRGVVTWADPKSDFFYLQDASRGVRVYFNGSELPELPVVGLSVHVTGYTGKGAFAPVVFCEEVVSRGQYDLPVPRSITLQQALVGIEEATFVEMKAVLRGVKREGSWTYLRLSTPSGIYHAHLPDTEIIEQAEQLVGAVIRLRGVCVALADENGHQIGVELLVSDWQKILVETPALEDPFSVNAVPLESLRKFGPLQAPYRWLRTSGVVTYVAGDRFILQSGTTGLEIFTSDSVAVSPGDAVEVVGFPGRQGNAVVLREALVREAAEEEAPRLEKLTEESALNPDLNNRLVQVDAYLEDAHQTKQGVLLHLRSGDVRFIGISNAKTSMNFKKGSLLRCVGIFQLQQDLLEQPESFKLFFRRPDDITLLQPPTFFTVKNMMIAIAAVSLGAIAALFWIYSLRKQVKEQTRLIREQMEHQVHLENELQKVAKLESLGLLAGGIAHDFNNLLTVMMGNITSAMLDDQVMEVAGDCLKEAEQGALRARDLTQQLLTFAKGGEPQRAAEVLPEIVREAAEFVLRGSNVRCDYEFDAGLWAANVDGGQINQVVHNLVLNAKQAMPAGGTIRVKAHNADLADRMVNGLPAGRYVQLVLADTGPGIPPEVLDHLFDPYFTTKAAGNGLGLATVHSIIRRHKGYIDVHSEVGHGTIFRIWLPAADVEVEEKKATPTKPRAKSLRGRILVMDDEEGIRRLVLSLMRRLGLDAVGVADGAEAIRVYQEALNEDHPFSLVIMDLTIPGGMGGLEAIGELRRIDPNVCAIVSSGYSADPVMANFKEYGFAGIVEKPYEVEDLMECVTQVLSTT
ncbi:MAG: response regulator [Pontiellaceae bacterium]|nr:response regulator [Pontiellaceae bacterium]